MPWHSSSKLATLLAMLDRMLGAEGDSGSASSPAGNLSCVAPARKVVVFSQWTSMLDLVEFALQNRLRTDDDANNDTTPLPSAAAAAQKRYVYRRLDGAMSQAARSSAVQSFAADDRVQIFLVSLK